MSDASTEQQFFAEYDRMKVDLAHARQEILLLSNQLRDANSEQEKLAFKCDFLTSEISRVTASREQYERVAIRVSGMMDGALDGLIAVAEKMKGEIREAAFTKTPSPPKPDPLPAEIVETKLPELITVDAQESRSALPAPRFGNGASH